jgi:hypothetical protein
MEIAYIIDMLLLAVAVSLGVGCSTVAITQFLVAVSDGEVDQVERKMLGVVYILLRVAMVAILVTLVIQAAIIYYITGSFLFVSPFFLALYTAVAVLYVNAIVMTMHWIPRQLGPAIQATSWYSLGILMALVSLNLIDFAYLEFLLVYIGVGILAAAALHLTLRKMSPKLVK